MWPLTSEYHSADPTLPARNTRLEYTNRLAHRAFNVQRLDVLPVLFQQRDQEVDAYIVGPRKHGNQKITSRGRTQHDVGQDLVICHLDMSYGNTQAKNFFKLEFNSRADFDELVCQVFRVGNRGWELSGCGEGWSLLANLNSITRTFRKTRTKKTRNLFDKGLGSQESIVFLRELLDKLLVLVEPA